MPRKKETEAELKKRRDTVLKQLEDQDIIISNARSERRRLSRLLSRINNRLPSQESQEG